MSSFNPSFLLRGVDPDEILRNYLNNGYQHYDCKEETEKVELIQGTTLLKEKITTNENNALYYVSFRNSSDNAICSRSGYQDMCKYLNGEEQVSGPCEICGREAIMGYPIFYKEIPSLIHENGVDYRKQVHCFWTEGRCCSFAHALTAVTRKANLLPPDCVQLVHLLYNFTYPKNPPLTESLDYLLLKKYGGSLSEEEWEKKSYKLVRSPYVVIIPAQVEYRDR